MCLCVWCVVRAACVVYISVAVYVWCVVSVFVNSSSYNTPTLALSHLFHHYVYVRRCVCVCAVCGFCVM